MDRVCFFNESTKMNIYQPHTPMPEVIKEKVAVLYDLYVPEYDFFRFKHGHRNHLRS